MHELRQRRAPRATRTPDASPAPPAVAPPAPPDSGEVEVIWGALPDRYEIAGMTVVEAYRLLCEHLGIPRGVRALLNGAPVEPTARLRTGDLLEFVRAAGERGAG